MAARGYDPYEQAKFSAAFGEATGIQRLPGISRYPEYSPQESEDYINRMNDGGEISASVNVGFEDMDAQYSDNTNTGPAPLTERPTSSTNAKRPRTVAAGFQLYVGSRKNLKPGESPLGKLTVMFRDGTLYNYYDVTSEEWQKFKGQLSKGPMLNWKPVPGFLLAKNHGPADVSQASESVRAKIYQEARIAQIKFANPRAVHVSYDAGTYTASKPQRMTNTVPRNVRRKMRKAAGKNPSTGGKNPY